MEERKDYFWMVEENIMQVRFKDEWVKKWGKREKERERRKKREKKSVHKGMEGEEKEIKEKWIERKQYCRSITLSLLP